jgi:hypothetical protein
MTVGSVLSFNKPDVIITNVKLYEAKLIEENNHLRRAGIAESVQRRATGLMAVGSSPGRVKNFLFSTSSRPALGPSQPHVQCVPGALSLGVNRPGREAEH